MAPKPNDRDDDDLDDDTDPDADADDTDADDDDLADLSDEELRDELRNTRAKLSRVNGQSMSRRKKLREKEAELEAARAQRAKPKSKDADDDEIDVEQIREQAKREGAAPALLRAKKAEAKVALSRAGVNPDRITKAVGLLPLDDLDLDDDGLDGIDDEIEDLKKSWPELFARPRRRRDSTAGNREDDDRRGRDAKPKTASEKAAAQLLGTGS